MTVTSGVRAPQPAARSGDALPFVWINGVQQAADAPHVSARDRGLTLADGAFETMRVRGGVVFRLDRHLARLGTALTALELPPPSALREWIGIAAHVAPAGDVSLRLTVTRGVGPGGVTLPADVHPTVILALNAMPHVPASVYESGLTGHVASGRRNERAATAGLKTLAYTDAVIGLLEARRAGADEAIFLDTNGHCSEATASNLFMWAENTLVTPPLTCGVLPGITRAAVLELAAQQGLRAVERAFVVSELLAAEEAFLTSSLRGLAPLVRADGHAIGSGTPGPITRRLTAAYSNLVAHECGG